ncbi:uncharacterized protein V6R79_003275 [Siganus canaliculatus]
MKRYNPGDPTLKFVDQDDCLDFLDENFMPPRALMSCGHPVTPMSLTKWCRRQLDEGEWTFVCGQIGCKAKWSYEEVRKMGLLTSEEAEYFEKQLFGNAAKVRGIKECPGCQCFVQRADPNNLKVQCPVCTAEKNRSYRFCWQCLKGWKNPAPRSDHCGNDGCVSPLEILKTCGYITFQHVQEVTGCPSMRACPTCGTLVEHDKTKCKNVVCPQCKVEFCFVCLKITKKCQEIKPYSYFKVCSTGVAPRQTSIPVWKKK